MSVNYVGKWLIESAPVPLLSEHQRERLLQADVAALDDGRLLWNVGTMVTAAASEAEDEDGGFESHRTSDSRVFGGL
jgi:hypothetical protein